MDFLIGLCAILFWVYEFFCDLFLFVKKFFVREKTRHYSEKEIAQINADCEKILEQIKHEQAQKELQTDWEKYYRYFEG